MHRNKESLYYYTSVYIYSCFASCRTASLSLSAMADDTQRHTLFILQHLLSLFPLLLLLPDILWSLLLPFSYSVAITEAYHRFVAYSEESISQRLYDLWDVPRRTSSLALTLFLVLSLYLTVFGHDIHLSSTAESVPSSWFIRGKLNVGFGAYARRIK
jgi:hypothetical protein